MGNIFRKFADIYKILFLILSLTNIDDILVRQHERIPVPVPVPTVYCTFVHLFFARYYFSPIYYRIIIFMATDLIKTKATDNNFAFRTLRIIYRTLHILLFSLADKDDILI